MYDFIIMFLHFIWYRFNHCSTITETLLKIGISVTEKVLPHIQEQAPHHLDYRWNVLYNVLITSRMKNHFQIKSFHDRDEVKARSFACYFHILWHATKCIRNIKNSKLCWISCVWRSKSQTVAYPSSSYVHADPLLCLLSFGKIWLCFDFAPNLIWCLLIAWYRAHVV